MDPKAASNDKHLLLVDDDRLILVTLAKGLSDNGYEVTTAISVDEAEIALMGCKRPDLVIIDVNMPGKDGLYLAERLRALDQVPFIFLSAYSNQSIVERATEYGALGYLIKPVDSPQLIPTIEAALARADEIRRLKRSERDLQVALDNERLISVAIGITMMHYRLGRKEAFELLRTDARSKRRKLADMAEDIVDAAEKLNLDPQNQNS